MDAKVSGSTITGEYLSIEESKSEYLLTKENNWDYLIIVKSNLQYLLTNGSIF